MTKLEFLSKLRNSLRGLPQDDIEERVLFYNEMIDDRVEEGLSEEEAVCEIGTIEKITAQIIEETPLPKLVKERVKAKRRMKAWEIILLVLGSPLWLSLALCAFALIFSLYIVLWSLIISLWAVEVSFAASSLGGLAAGAIFIFQSNVLSGVAMIGAGIVCAGLSIFLFFGSKAATKGTLLLTKKIALGIKNCFIKKEGA